MLTACPGQSALLLIPVILLLLMVAGCSDVQGSSVVFPVHDAPLGTDRGGEYFAGRLVLIEGCLRVEVPSNDADNPRPSLL